MTDRIRLSGDDYYTDPYPLYAELCARGSIHPVRFPAVKAWLVTGHAAAVSALTDPRLGKHHSRGNDHWRARASTMPEPYHSELQVHLLHQDPPRHTAMRDLVAGAFSVRRSEAQRASIRAQVAGLIDAFPAQGPVDLVAAFAGRLPFLALVDAIGLPTGLADRFDPAWCSVVAPVGPNDPRRPRYESLLAGLKSYIGEVVAHVEAAPTQEGLLAQLVAAYAQGKLARAELDSIIFQLLAAGQEPVTNQISMAILTLLRHPEALRWLRDHPEAIERAVEELLRFESAFSLTTWRFFAEDTEVDAQTVPAGDSVIVGLGAANRDPARFAEPDRLDLRRSPNPHIAFGHGIHFCVAAALARVELQEAVLGLVRRLPGLRMACGEDELSFHHAALARGVAALPIDYAQVLP